MQGRLLSPPHGFTPELTRLLAGANAPPRHARACSSLDACRFGRAGQRCSHASARPLQRAGATPGAPHCCSTLTSPPGRPSHKGRRARGLCRRAGGGCGCGARAAGDRQLDGTGCRDGGPAAGGGMRARSEQRRGGSGGGGVVGAAAGGGGERRRLGLGPGLGECERGAMRCRPPRSRASPRPRADASRPCVYFPSPENTAYAEAKVASWPLISPMPHVALPSHVFYQPS